MAQGAKGIKSVNYVVSDIKITKMVEPENVAFCSQSGNPVTVSIEFQPTLTDEGYKRGGWLISELEKKYGKLQLYKHSFWFPTACPGTIDINRLRAEANKGDNMADKIDANLSRVIAHGILGRNGLSGRNYALDGSAGDPWVGGELTAKFIMDVFNSVEARGWRDGKAGEYGSVSNINERLAELKRVQARVTELEKQLADAGKGYKPVGQLYEKA